MSGGGVSVAQYQCFSTPDIYDEQIATQRRSATSPPVWNSRTTPLSDVLHGGTTPTVVRYCGRRDELVRRDVYVHSVSPSTVVVADGLTADPRSGLVPTGRRYLIPVDHRGWFELLSQDGHAASPITTVQQLMKSAPQRCLVRRTIVGLSGDNTGRWACKVSAGETLSIEGVVTSPTSNSQCLRCRIDSTGHIILLAADQRGLFSPVAGPTNVAGLHRMRSIVAKFRFPVIVRLISRNNSTTESSSSNNSGSAMPSAAFRVIAVQTEQAAYVVPLWLIKFPSDTSRRSLLSLPTSAQASGVLDGVASTSETTSGMSEYWTEAEWNELRRRCDELIKSRAVTAEMTRLLIPTHNVDDRQRAARATSPVQASHQPQSAAGDEEWRLLREIDHIYESIKARDMIGHKNGIKTTTTTRQIPRRYRSVRQDGVDTTTAAVLGRTVSPMRRSSMIDPLYMKSSQLAIHQHNNSFHPIMRAHSQHQLNNHRQTSASPVRLRRVVSHTMSNSAFKRHSPPLLPHQLQLQDSEPIYEELRCTGHMNTETGDVLENGQYVVLADSPRAPADNLRQLIKHRPTAVSSRPPHYSRHVEPSRRWSVAAVSDHSVFPPQLQVFDDLTSTNDVPVVPVTRQLDGTSTAVKPLPDAVSNGRLMSTSSDDVTAAADRKSSSAMAAVKRALCRHVSVVSKTDAPAAENVHLSGQARVYPLFSQRTDNTSSRHSADIALTSHDVIAALDYVGGKVTHF